MKKKLYMLAIGLILTGIGQVFAQQDIKAREILDKTLAVFQQSKGVQACQVLLLPVLPVLI